jgi:hypothetical protein
MQLSRLFYFYLLFCLILPSTLWGFSRSNRSFWTRSEEKLLLGQWGCPGGRIGGASHYDV